MRTPTTGLGLLSAYAFKTGTDTRLPAQPCPSCGKMLDGHSGERGASPKAGDLSICIYCTARLTYGPELELLPLGDEEYEALPEDVRAVFDNARALMVQAMMGRPKRGVQA